MKVLLSLKTGKKFRIDDISVDYHCKEGTIKKQDLNNNGIIESNLGFKFLNSDMNNYDKSLKIKRGPQILINKDLGYIIARTRINKNSTIVEAGGGSGAATIFFANLVKKVITYEIIEKHSEIIEHNLKKSNITNVKLYNKDLEEDIEKIKNYDLLFLDLPEPMNILNKNLKGLNPSSYIVCYLPSIFQIHELVNQVTKYEHYFIEEVSEIIHREWKINSRVSRPEHQKQTDHTAFLVFIRKI